MKKLKWQALQEKYESCGAIVGYTGIKIIRIKVTYNSLTHKTRDRPWLLTYNETTHKRYATKEKAMSAAEEWFAGFVASFIKVYGDKE